MFLEGQNERVWLARRRRYRETTVGSWQQRWLHWGGHGASEAHSVVRYTGSPWVRSREEIGSEARPSELVGRHGDVPAVSVRAPCLEFVKLIAPLDTSRFMKGHETWDQDLEMECRLCVAPNVPALV